jgi:hypothetical protein
MSGPPKGKPWVWLTRDLLRSASWQGLGINARRLVDFLLIEHMNHGGQANGFLLAPRRQLEEFGIGHRLITGAIEEARRAGLIDVKRGVGCRPSTFALTWLPLAAHPAAGVHQGERQGATKVNDKVRSRARTGTASAQNDGSRRCTPYKNSYQGRGDINDLCTPEAQSRAEAFGSGSAGDRRHSPSRT